MSKQRDIQPYWRPDFKIQSTLPDIKVVRTDFIINAIAVALALIAAFTVLQREYRAFSLNRAIASMQQSIGETEANNNQNLQASERFRESAQSVVELQDFFRAPFAAHQIAQHHLPLDIEQAPEGCPALQQDALATAWSRRSH